MLPKTKSPTRSGVSASRWVTPWAAPNWRRKSPQKSAIRLSSLMTPALFPHPTRFDFVAEGRLEKR